MSDRAAVVLAVLVFAAALAAVDGHLPGVALPAGPAMVGAGAASLRHDERIGVALICIGAALLAASLGQRSVEGLVAPLDTGRYRGEVTLVADPAPDGRGGVDVDVRLGARRLRAVARSSAAAALDGRLAGERVTVIGSVQPPTPYDRFLRHRHVAGRLAVETVVGWRPGDAGSTAANGLRRTLAAGAESLPERQQSLLAGLTLGDDRAQPADLTDAFQAAGLTHLLAVSGQNIAFVLVVARPVLSRLTFGPRLLATLGVLVAFALVTRFEPSVLRASAMAAVAAVGVAVGRPASSLRALALGVGAMVLVDPLLTTSLGFRLSVAGAAGIVVAAAPIERRLPGPPWLAAPLAVTLAAQAAVSPLLVATFGGVPVASVPANLLAAPAAGPIMVWGLTAGFVAGLTGGPLAALLHLPSRVLLGWLDVVAGAAVRWPLGDLGLAHLVLLTAAGLLGAACRRPCPVAPDPWSVLGKPDGRPSAPSARSAPSAGRWLGRWAAGALAVAAVASPAVVAARPGADRAGAPLGPGAVLWRAGDGTAVQVDGRARAEAMLAALRREQVRRVDVVVVRTPARVAMEAAATLRRRWPDAMVLVPRAALDRVAAEPRLRGARTLAIGTVVEAGDLRLTPIAVADHLEVDVTVRGARPPPAGRVSSAVVPLRSRPPTSPGDVVSLAGRQVDVRTRVLVAAVVPAPRFGREAEVVATALATAATGADLVDVSLEPRLLGPAARAIDTPVAARAASLDGAAAAARAGAHVVLVPAGALDAGVAHLDVADAAVAVVVDDVGLVAAGLEVARTAGVPLAFDSTALAGVDAVAAEAVAVTDGCRILCTTDVRRSRRVAEVLGAVLAAQRGGPVVRGGPWPT